MTNDVVLTAALRGNLLSLQNTQRSIDATQLRLATGLKVNSALDNPQNFFAAEALGNRANDLQRLLDGIGQNIQVIKAADNGVTALTSLIEQAESIAQSAQDALAQGTSEARETGDRDLRNISDLTQLAGINDGDTLTIRVNSPDDKTQFIDFDETTSATQDDLVITINTGDSIDELITSINDNNNIQTPVLKAGLNSDGQLEIKTLNGGDFQIDFISNAPIGADTDATNLSLSAALGFGEIVKVIGDETINANSNNVQFTSLASTTIRSFEFYEAGGGGTDRAERSDLLSTLEDENGTALFASLGILENFTFSVNGGASIQDLPIGGLTIQGFIDTINSDANVNELIRLDFDDETSQITITAIDESVTDITIGAYNTSVLDDMNFGFGLNDFTNLQGNFSGSQYQENIRFGKGAGRLAELELEYNAIKNQIDQLVTNGDTGYRGTNLLNGDDLVTFFNEFRSSSLTTEGVNFNSTGLGLNEAKFADESSVNLALSETREALETVRNFGNTLANDLAVIQARESFTKNMINTLEEGADKLTLADQNEEGAKLLAQQTRLALGVTALELAANSQRSILRLF